MISLKKKKKKGGGGKKRRKKVGMGEHSPAWQVGF
jgi:hypothetical protein